MNRLNSHCFKKDIKNVIKYDMKERKKNSDLIVCEIDWNTIHGIKWKQNREEFVP